MLKNGKQEAYAQNYQKDVREKNSEQPGRHGSNTASSFRIPSLNLTRKKLGTPPQIQLETSIKQLSIWTV